VEVAHLLAHGTVALVDPNRVVAVGILHIRWELELELVLHIAAVAGSWVRFEGGHGRRAVCVKDD
jgi:hypothetical protein